MAAPDSTVAPPQRRRGEIDPDHCAQCQAPLREDQEFCLRCGSSRSLIYSPPDWRFPVAVVVIVVVIALAGFVFALSRLSDNAGRTAAAKSATASAAAASSPAAGGPSVTGAAGTATTSTSAAVSGIASWPVGQDGWTVVIEKDHDESDAYTKARQIAPTVTGVGVLNSSDHPSMTPGYWIVFSGRYPDQTGAETAATKLVSAGYAGAKARRVAKPGGL